MTNLVQRLKAFSLSLRGSVDMVWATPGKPVATLSLTTATDTRDVLLEAAETIEKLQTALWDMQRGPDCWCEMAIDNPMVKEHTIACQQARAALNVRS